MKLKKSLIILCFIICVISITSVAANDVNETGIVGENQNDEVMLVESQEIDNEGLLERSISESDEIVSINQNDDDILSASSAGDSYKNVNIKTVDASYKENKRFTYGFEGNLHGYFKIYKGKSLVYSKAINTNDNKKHTYNFAINTIKDTGVFTAKIVNNAGKEIVKSKFKINKAPSTTSAKSYTVLGGYKDTVYMNVHVKFGSRDDVGGTAKFKIGGKTYKAKVKHGAAKVKANFPSKKKTYKCRVNYLGDKHYKGSSDKFKIKTIKLANPIKVGKYSIKLSSKQYKSLVKSILKPRHKKINIKTNYKYKVKKPYLKQVKRYKTTRCCKTLYAGSYLPTMQRMKYNGWHKVSQYTYTKKNPQNKYGIGLSAYTYAVTKWVKISYKWAYKTKYYPVKAKISTNGKWMGKPTIKIYSHGTTLKNKKIALR